MASCASGPVRLQDSLIIVFLEGIDWPLSFLDGDNLQGKVACETTSFWLVVAWCVSHPIRLKDSWISNQPFFIYLFSYVLYYIKYSVDPFIYDLFYLK